VWFYGGGGDRAALYCKIRGCDHSAILIGGFSHAHKGRRSSACACSKLVLFSPLLKAVSKFRSQLMTVVQFLTELLLHEVLHQIIEKVNVTRKMNCLKLTLGGVSKNWVYFFFLLIGSESSKLNILTYHLISWNYLKFRSFEQFRTFKSTILPINYIIKVGMKWTILITWNTNFIYRLYLLLQPSSETALLEVKAREERERPTVAFELFHLTDE
jgi:hypothetical protein